MWMWGLKLETTTVAVKVKKQEKKQVTQLIKIRNKMLFKVVETVLFLVTENTVCRLQHKLRIQTLTHSPSISLATVGVHLTDKPQQSVR